jgi:hypothetical protein
MDGKPAYEVPKADGKGMRKTTIADARKLSLLPSCTTILKTLDKPALNAWKTEQACLALATTPRLPDEKDDAFVLRVLHTEKIQEEEGQMARDLGTDIHAALENYFTGQAVPPDMEAYVRPLINHMITRGALASAEMVLVGNGYAGRVDLVQDCESCWAMTDFKSARKLPEAGKVPYIENRLQLSAYAKAFQDKLRKAGNAKPIIVSNAYISTTTPGEFVIIEHEDWEGTYEKGFAPLLAYWSFANNYFPISTPTPSLLETEMDKMGATIAELNERLATPEARYTPDASLVQTGVSALPPAPIIPTKPGLPTVSSTGQKLQWSVGVSATTPQPGKPL